jgi:hypothetical protein
LKVQKKLGKLLAMEEKSKEEKSIEVKSSIGDEREGLGRVWIKEFDAKARVGNAFKKLLLFWMAAGVCLFIPGLHFILVPLFFIMGLIAFSKTSKLNGRVLKGSVDCPFCKTPVKIGTGLLNWPLKEICQKCGRAIRIRPKSDPTKI